MRILVGDLAKIYDLSNQALHYYEERGFLKPERDSSNGYRYFSLSDLRLLGLIKKTRNLGLPVGIGAQLATDASVEDTISEYQKRREELFSEIEERQMILRQLDRDMGYYRRYLERKDQFLVEELDGFLRFESAGTEIIFQSDDMRKEATPWFKNIFFTSGSDMLYPDSHGNYSHFTNGMAATMDTAHYLKLKQSENVQVIEPGRFITAVISYEKMADNAKLYNDCITYARENRLKPRGLPFTLAIIISRQPQKTTFVKRLIMPVF